MMVTRSLFLSSNICRNHLINNIKIKHKNFLTFPLISSSFKKFFATQSNNENNKIQIYYGSLTPRMKAVKVFSLTTSLSGLAAQPILMEQGAKIGGTGMAIFLCSFVGFFTFVTPLLLHLITKKYVTEINYDPKNDEYTATTISIILRKIQTKFKCSDVQVPEVPGMFTSIIIGKKPLFLDPSQFTDPEHYVKIMGYDKPIDFKINFTEKNDIEDLKKSK